MSRVVLALSTSTPRGSVALLRDGVPIGSSGYADLQGHAERIFEAIDRVLAEGSVTRAELTALACDVGPGSFTGVRVGLATAKGICLALGLPLVGVGSLEAMGAAAFGEGVAEKEAVVVAAIDAKKGEVFVAGYDAAGLEVATARTALAGPAAFVIEEKARPVVVVGEIAGPILGEGASRRGASVDLPDAAWIGRLADARLAKGERPDAAEVEAVYVRPPDITLPGGVPAHAV